MTLRNFNLGQPVQESKILAQNKKTNKQTKNTLFKENINSNLVVFIYIQTIYKYYMNNI